MDSAGGYQSFEGRWMFSPSLATGTLPLDSSFTTRSHPRSAFQHSTCGGADCAVSSRVDTRTALHGDDSGGRHQRARV